MANTVGPLIKAARTKAGMTQEQLAKQLEGLSASDISKAERGEKELTQAQLKLIAKLTGVTQASLLNAAKEDAAKASGTSTKPSTAKKTEAAKTSTAKKTETAKTSTAKKPTAKKEEEIKLTAAEKKLLEAYRAADKDDKELALKILKGEKLDLMTALGGTGLLDGAMGFLSDLGKK